MSYAHPHWKRKKRCIEKINQSFIINDNNTYYYVERNALNLEEILSVEHDPSHDFLVYTKTRSLDPFESLIFLYRDYPLKFISDPTTQIFVLKLIFSRY